MPAQSRTQPTTTGGGQSGFESPHTGGAQSKARQNGGRGAPGAAPAPASRRTLAPPQSAQGQGLTQESIQPSSESATAVANRSGLKFRRSSDG